MVSFSIVFTMLVGRITELPMQQLLLLACGNFAIIDTSTLDLNVDLRTGVQAGRLPLPCFFPGLD
ncbi:hypothetical protein GOB86_00465 [Acetobacter lambici]|uniref:Uncharacterized protein n=2 Tax=Acetobacter lambici TaxID=1332824 RepID=A0ABT1EVT4_9PROT|nr:hypothetical protein [Acetobacter lambici]MCP1257067.1 hypothetical protein [Acetobacter lambici]NHO55560.1 hypothetical protein [Acetobacter lambici]